MSEPSLEIVRRMYAAFHAGDATGALAHFDPEVVLDARQRLDVGVVHGRDELAATIAGWVGAFDDWQERIEDVHVFSQQVVVVLTQRGRGKGSGVELETRYATLFETHGDTIVRLTLFADPADALAAAEHQQT